MGLAVDGLELADLRKLTRYSPTKRALDARQVHADLLKRPHAFLQPARSKALTASAPETTGGRAVRPRPRPLATVTGIPLANSSPTQAATLTVKLSGLAPKTVAGRVLTAPAMDAHNTFAAPNAVQPAAFSGATVKGDTLEVKLPAKSVVVLALK